jgi:putative membrane protein
VDFITWATVAMCIQLLFALVVTRIKGKFSFEKQINEGAISAGILKAFLSISIGLLNAGSMSY